MFQMLRTERGIVLEGRGRSGSRGVSNAKNRKRDSSGFSALLLPENVRTRNEFQGKLAFRSLGRDPLSK